MIFTVTNKILVDPPGNYTVMLTITDGQGNILAAAPPAPFTVPPPKGTIIAETPTVEPAVSIKHPEPK